MRRCLSVCRCAVDERSRRRRVPAWAIAAVVAGLFVGICGYARWSGHWHSDVPERVYFQWIPRADEVGHP